MASISRGVVTCTCKYRYDDFDRGLIQGWTVPPDLRPGTVTATGQAGQPNFKSEGGLGGAGERRSGLTGTNPCVPPPLGISPT